MKATFKPLAGAAVSAAGTSAATAYVLAVVVFLATASLSLVFSRGEDSAVAGVRLPAGATCVRARREENYAVALVPVGSPTREAEVLFRPDRVVDSAPFWILSTANEQSAFLNCSGLACSDLALLQRGGDEAFQRSRVEYTYHSARDDASFAGAWLGLKGELRVLRGFGYWLTTTRLCWAPTEDVGEGTPANTSSGYMVGDAADFETDCEGAVNVFPVAAGHESHWLAVTGTYLREHAEASLEERRRHAEAGARCGPDNTPWRRDCTAAHSCEALPSVTYRRALARQNVVIRTLGDRATLRFEATPSLGRVPGLLDSGSALVLGVLQMMLMALASAVAFVRRSHESSDSVAMLRRARSRVVRGGAPPEQVHTQLTVWVDAAIGLLAVLARAAVVAVMSDTLWEDGLAAVVVGECVGCGVSLVHLLLRNCVLDVDPERELPLTKLGGSMALLDSAAAILVSFADPPAFGSHHVFAGLGRLLAALLVAINGIPLGIFAAVVCGAMASGLRDEDIVAHARLLWLSIALWIAQLSSVGVAVAHVFCRTFAFQLFRVYAGERLSMTLVLFGVVFLVSVPTQNRVVLEISRG
jgi:hypothetical protein